MSQRPEDVTMPFGKYAGKTLGDIVAEDPAYLDWLSGIDIQNPVLLEAVMTMCDTYAAEIERAVGED